MIDLQLVLLQGFASPSSIAVASGKGLVNYP